MIFGQIADGKNRRLYTLLEHALRRQTPPVIIGITGAGGAGKTTLATNIARWLGESCLNVDLDDYLISRDERGRLELTGYHPAANRLKLAREHIEQLRRGQAIDKPTYNHEQGTVESTANVAPREVMIFEGVTTLYPELNDLYSIAIFIDAKEETQIKSRIERDVKTRGYTLDEALTLFETLRPLYSKYIEPTKAHAHLVGIVSPDYIFHPTHTDNKLFGEHE